MRVLLLTWDVGHDATVPVGDARTATPTQGHGLATALAAGGHTVRVVTRAGPDGPAAAVDGVETHVVADAPPIVPSELADPVLDALAFANRATSVAVRRLEEAAVDVVHAEGWQTGPVVAALRHSHDVPVVAALEPRELAATRPAAADLAAALASTADVVLQRTVGAVEPGVVHLPTGVALPARRPGPPPTRGPLVLVVPSGVAHRDVAARIRRRLAAPRRISRSWGHRPLAVAVLDPHDLDSTVRAMARGVPVVAVPGPTGDLVAASGAGEVLPAAVGAAVAEVAAGAPTAELVARIGRAVADAVDRLVAERSRTVAFGAAATDAAASHGWSAVAAAWAAAATRATRRRGRPRLHAAG